MGINRITGIIVGWCRRLCCLQRCLYDWDIATILGWKLFSEWTVYILLKKFQSIYPWKHTTQALRGRSRDFGPLQLFFSSQAKNSPNKVVWVACVVFQGMINLPPVEKFLVATSSELFQTDHVPLTAVSERSWNLPEAPRIWRQILGHFRDWVMSIYLFAEPGSWYFNETWEIFWGTEF